MSTVHYGIMARIAYASAATLETPASHSAMNHAARFTGSPRPRPPCP